MLRPLEQFKCDECGQTIDSPSDGYVEWEEVEEDGHYTVRGLRIVHKPHASPNYGGCYRYEGSPYRLDNELTFFLEYPQQHLFSFLDPGIVHNREQRNFNKVADFPAFVDFFKRLTIPYYEEARIYFPQAMRDGLVDDNEIGLYTPERLQAIIEHYAGRAEEREE